MTRRPDTQTRFFAKEGEASNRAPSHGGMGLGQGYAESRLGVGVCDVLVIGAGPAGSVAARELARRGCRVLLVDKSSFPRAKVCGCCLNGAAVAALKHLGLGHVLSGAVPLKRASIAAGRRSANITLTHGVAISRAVFDARLVEEAVNAGVEFRPNTMVSSRHPRGSEFGEAITVLATGLAGGNAPAEDGSRIGAGVGLSAEEAPAFFGAGTIYMATASGGYVGLVQVEDGLLDVAAAFDAAFVKLAGGLGQAAETILREVGWPIPRNLAEQPWKGTPALTRIPTRLAGHRFFVVGDAAGYVEPFTGEGMAWAIMSATALAPLAARAVRQWDEQFVAEWKSLHRRVVGRRQKVCRVVSRVLRSPRLTGIAIAALGMFPVLSRPLVSALNRPSSFSCATPHEL